MKCWGINSETFFFCSKSEEEKIRNQLLIVCKRSAIRCDEQRRRSCCVNLAGSLSSTRWQNKCRVSRCHWEWPLTKDELHRLWRGARTRGWEGTISEHHVLPAVHTSHPSSGISCLLPGESKLISFWITLSGVSCKHGMLVEQTILTKGLEYSWSLLNTRGNMYVKVVFWLAKRLFAN